MARNSRSDENWVTNMCQKFEAACQDIDDFVYKDPVLFVRNQVQTVCRSVKKLYSDVMQDLILSPKCIDLAEAFTSSVAAVKETTVRRNISKPKEAPVVPEMRHQPSISALRQSKRISSEDSVLHRDDNLLSKAVDQAIQLPVNSSTSNQETVVMEQSTCKDEKCDDDHELFLREDLENNDKSSELVDTESSQSDEAYLDALLNSSTSSQEDFKVEQSSCKDEKCDDDHEKFFRELYENHRNSLAQLSYETFESDDSVSEDRDWGMKKKKFDIRSDAKFLRGLLEKKEFCNVSSQSNDLELENEGSGIENKKIEVLFHEKLENHTISSKQLGDGSSQSDDSVSEDGYWSMEEKKFDIKSDAKFLRELLEKKSFCNVSSPSDDSRLVIGGSGIEGKKIEVLFHEKLENDATSSKLLDNESSQIEDSVSEDGYWSMEEKKFDIKSDAKFLRELLEKKSFCNVSSPSDDSRLVIGGSGIEGKKIEVLFHEKLENDATSSKLLDNESSQIEDSVSEDGDCGIEEISDLNVGTDEQIEVELSQNKSSEMESLITCNENKVDSSNSSFKNVSVEPDTIDCNPAEGHMSISSRGLSSCEPITALCCDISNDPTRFASSSYSVSDDTIKTDEPVSITGLGTSEYSHNWNVAQFEALCWSEIGIVGKSTADAEELIMDNIDLSEKKQLAEVESSQNKSSELESSITCNENNEDSLSSSFKSVAVEPDTINCNPAEGHISISSGGPSSCEPVTALGCDSSNDPTRLASSSYLVSDDTTRTDEPDSITVLGTSEYSHNWNVAQSEALCWSEIDIGKIPTGGADTSTVDSEELIMENTDLSDNKQLAESCVMVEGKLLNFSHRPKGSRSYKKIIQDAFMSKRRLRKEYEQLSVLYGDIDNEFNPPIGNGIAPKLPTEDLPDSKWEIL